MGDLPKGDCNRGTSISQPILELYIWDWTAWWIKSLISHAAVLTWPTPTPQVRESAELAAEEQLEETTDRQLEEIDEQMRAWSRVSEYFAVCELLLL